MIGARNVKGGLLFVSLALLGGVAMSLYAFEPIVTPPAGFKEYDDLPRRLVRLAHVAAVMLPLLNVVLGGWIDRVALSRRGKEWASWLLLVGGVGVPGALLLEAAWAPARHLHVAGPPVLAVTLGVILVTLGAARTNFQEVLR